MKFKAKEGDVIRLLSDESNNKAHYKKGDELIAVIIDDKYIRASKKGKEGFSNNDYVLLTEEQYELVVPQLIIGIWYEFNNNGLQIGKLSNVTKEYYTFTPWICNKSQLRSYGTFSTKNAKDFKELKVEDEAIQNYLPNGHIDKLPGVCEDCNGKGIVMVGKLYPSGHTEVDEECSRCNGSGCIEKEVLKTKEPPIPEYVEALGELCGISKGKIYSTKGRYVQDGKYNNYPYEDSAYFKPSTEEAYNLQNSPPKPILEDLTGRWVKWVKPYAGNSNYYGFKLGEYDQITRGNVMDGNLNKFCNYEKLLKYFELMPIGWIPELKKKDDLVEVPKEQEEKWMPQIGDWAVSLIDTFYGRKKNDVLKIVTYNSYSRGDKIDNFDGEITQPKIYETLRKAFPHEITSESAIFNIPKIEELKKPVDLVNTKIWIGDNKDLASKIEKRALELGWTYPGSGFLSSPYFIVFNPEKTMYKGVDGDMGIQGFKKSGYKEIFPRDLGINEQSSEMYPQVKEGISIPYNQETFNLFVGEKGPFDRIIGFDPYKTEIDVLDVFKKKSSKMDDKVYSQQNPKELGKIVINKYLTI